MRPVDPIRLKRRALITDDHLSPSSLELYDTMWMTTCLQAELEWNADWTKCPVCMCELEDGVFYHQKKKHS